MPRRAACEVLTWQLWNHLVSAQAMCRIIVLEVRIAMDRWTRSIVKDVHSRIPHWR
jgi:hypothetical protein